ncbi:hypothetical protein [Burkholderia sp. MSMB1072]|uniref:hypothetical protein n=1 Tax=Burkholderia sp. MSMB1072 TaxID=1637871 RepID=UPI000A54C395|nr:hypothetical protein [Burkholderia sp. MSMB1072]
MASILPNGKTQFVDQNGKPLANGTVTFYQVGTTTKKDTWQDPAMTQPNTNPVVLDSRGQATIWGDGSYRQIVNDKFGALIWDQTTSTNPSTPIGQLSILDYGARCDWNGTTGTDDTAAINLAFTRALAQGISVVTAPSNGKSYCPNGIVVPTGICFQSEGFIPSTSGTPSGFQIVVSSGAAVACRLQGNAGLGAAALKRMTITRVGVPAAGTYGVYVDNGYNPIIEDVASIGHAIPWVWDGTKGGISCSPLRIFSGYATDAHVLVNSWPELRPAQCRFGSNGLIDVACNAYVRFTGGGSGPNTAMFDNCQFNQGESGDNIIGTFLDFVNFGSGQGQIIGQFNFSNCHVEQAQHAIRTDSTVSILDNLQITDTRFQDNNNVSGSAEFWALNAATKLQSFKMADCVLTTKSFTLAPGQQMDGVTVTNVKFFKPISVTGVGNSVVNFEACDYNSVTIAGSFGAAKFTGVASTGALSNTATGKVTLDITNQSNWTAAAPPQLQFGGATTGISYSVQQAQWRLQGSTVIYQFAISLTSKGSATGVATIAGLPFQIQGVVGAAGGGAIPVAANLTGMTGPVIAQPAAFATMNLLQSAPGGYAQMTDANFTNTTNISGELIYPV